MSIVVPFRRRCSVIDAWEHYRSHASRAVADRSLLLDRNFMEEAAKREAAWRKLFLASEA